MSLLIPQTSFAKLDIRQPAHAGTFYPGESAQLSQIIDALLRGKPALRQKPSVLMVPHAGYRYSGTTAAKAYASLQGHDIETVILVGPCHRTQIDGAVIWTGDAWQTPMGMVNINQGLARKLSQENDRFIEAQDCHAHEHSLEVQVPFIQKILPKATIVPVAINDRELAFSLAKSIKKHMDDKTVVVVTSDLSHYHPMDIADKIDSGVQTLVQLQDPRRLKQALDTGRVEMCGGAAFITGLEIGHLQGHPKMHFIERTHSGQTAGDPSSVVGYLSAAITNPYSYSKAHQGQLLTLAKNTLRTYFKLPIDQKIPVDQAFLFEKGVFITIREKPKVGESEGRLRGCMGSILPVASVFDSVMRMTLDSAFKDGRFPPVKLEELSNLTLDVSILNVPQRVRSADAVVFGKHGVIIGKGEKRGLFLPEVAESFETKDAFLSELCFQKAGLPRDCWKTGEAEIFTFTTQHFGPISIE